MLRVFNLINLHFMHVKSKQLVQNLYFYNNEQLFNKIEYEICL